MSNPTADAQNGKQVSPPPYTPLTDPAGDALNATRGEGLLKSCPFCGGKAERYEDGRFIECGRCGAAVGSGNLPQAAHCWNTRHHTQPVAVEQGVDDAVVLGRIRAVVDAWVSPLMPRGEAAGQMLEAVRSYLRAGAVEQGVERYIAEILRLRQVLRSAIEGIDNKKTEAFRPRLVDALFQGSSIEQSSPTTQATGRDAVVKQGLVSALNLRDMLAAHEENVCEFLEDEDNALRHGWIKDIELALAAIQQGGGHD